MKVKVFVLVLAIFALIACEKGIENPYSPEIPEIVDPDEEPDENPDLAAEVVVAEVGQGTAWNIGIVCPSSSYSLDYRMYMYMKLKNVGDLTATGIILHLEISDGTTLVWSGTAPFTSYDGSIITLEGNKESSGWFMWRDQDVETLEMLYSFLVNHSGSTPVQFHLTWD